MSRPTSLMQHFWPSFLLMLASGSFCACTQQNGDEGPSQLFREVPVSTQNWALSFDGVGDYATTGTAMFPVGRSAQTISAWFELDVIAGKHALITLRKDGDSGVELALQDGLLGAWRVYGNRTLVIASTPVSAGGWHHAAYTFDGTTNQIFVDGALVASTTNLPDERTPTTCWLGTLDGSNDLFKGNIDDFRVFSATRSNATIAAEAGGSFSSADTNIVLDLPCNEDSGDLLYDHSPLANDGQLGDGVDQRKPRRVTSGAPDDLN